MRAINQLLAAGLSKNVPSSRHLEPVQLANRDFTICFPPLNYVEITKCKELLIMTNISYLKETWLWNNKSCCWYVARCISIRCWLFWCPWIHSYLLSAHVAYWLRVQCFSVFELLWSRLDCIKPKTFSFLSTPEHLGVIWNSRPMCVQLPNGVNAFKIYGGSILQFLTFTDRNN